MFEPNGGCAVKIRIDHDEMTALAIFNMSAPTRTVDGTGRIVNIGA
jgi:hypothetical protein